MTLTEQWKKGELERGRYYIKYRGNYMQDNWHGDCWEDSWSEYVEEVLAPVPTYEEWQELKEFADYSLHNRDELTRQINFWMDKHTQIEKENQQLHKFLEEFNALEVAKENDKLKTENKWYSEQLNEAVKEVSQLKELLKECKETIETSVWGDCSALTDQIDEVLK